MILGDFNLDPHVVQHALASLITARVMTAGHPTCKTAHGESEIDMYVLSECLDPWVKNEFCFHEVEVVTHTAVMLEFRRASEDTQMQVCVAFPKIPAERPVGPSPCPPS